MATKYTGVNWENSPSKKTPITAENLGIMNQGIVDAHEDISRLEETIVDYTVDGYFALEGKLSSRYFTKNGESIRENSVMMYALPSDVKYIAVDMMILPNVYFLAFTDSYDKIIDVCISTVGYTEKTYKNICVPQGATTLWLTNNSSNVLKIKAFGKKQNDYMYTKENADHVGFINTDGSVNTKDQYGYTRKICIDDAESITTMSVYSAYVASIAFYDVYSNFVGYIAQTNQNDSGINSVLEVSKNDFPNGSKYAVVSMRTDIDYKSSVVVKYTKIQETKTNDLKFMCFGDSITSDEVSGTGSRICEMLGAIMIKNFAHGNATCQDYKSTDGTINISPETPDVTYKVEGGTANQMPANVLSNQVKRALCYSTPVGENVSYTHPKAGVITLNNEIWTGTGSAENIPDIIYIAIGINDGAGWTNEDGTTYRPTAYDSKGNQHDDSEEVYTQDYALLTRLGFANALRWAIETIQCAYPKAQIFVVSPMQTKNIDWVYQSFANTKMKREITEKMAIYNSVHFIDAFGESGYSSVIASDPNNGDGTHPSNTWVINNARFVTNEIKRKAFAKRI